jgi:hypothetical protein
VILSRRKIDKKSHSYQLLPRLKDKVTVRIDIKEKLFILWKNNKLLVKELTHIQLKKLKKSA